MDPDLLASTETTMLVVAFGRWDDTLHIFGPYDYLALQKASIPAEMHIFENGPHGVGLANDDRALSNGRSCSRIGFSAEAL
jgi:hypothetical protein